MWGMAYFCGRVLRTNAERKIVASRFPSTSAQYFHPNHANRRVNAADTTALAPMSSESVRKRRSRVSKPTETVCIPLGIKAIQITTTTGARAGVLKNMANGFAKAAANAKPVMPSSKPTLLSCANCSSVRFRSVMIERPIPKVAMYCKNGSKTRAMLTMPKSAGVSSRITIRNDSQEKIWLTQSAIAFQATLRSSE